VPSSEGTTEAVTLRRGLAAALAAACPAALARDIAVTGSVARGLADAHSDIELNFWVDGPELPAGAARTAWLRDLGVEDLRTDSSPMPDASWWSTFRWRGVWVEAGWQRTADLDRSLADLLAVRAGGHAQREMAWTIVGALPLRDSGWLPGWKGRLADYPAGLAARVIEANTSVWQHPQFLAVREALIARGELFALNERLTWDLYNVLQCLFALNRMWDPDWKWLRAVVDELPVKPRDLAARVEAVVSGPRPKARLAACRGLMADTLALLPETPGVLRAKQALASVGGRA